MGFPQAYINKTIGTHRPNPVNLLSHLLSHKLFIMVHSHNKFYYEQIQLDPVFLGIPGAFKGTAIGGHIHKYFYNKSCSICSPH